MGQICFILIGRNLKWSVLIGREHFTTRAPRENPLLSLKCGALSDWSRAGRYGSIVSTVLMGREQSRDLRRHSSSFTYHVTSMETTCFAAMLFCDDTITRGRCYGSRSTVSTVLMGREQSRDI